MFTISNAISNTKLKSALIPFITAGYPNLSVTSEVIRLLDNEGVNAIELGIPYSDALADGPLIQEASRVALQQKVCFEQILNLVKQLNRSIKTPLIIFTYLNPLLSRGAHSFIKDISKVGIKGLVIPDLPIEEADYFIDICTYYNIELILFISPASPEKRIEKIISKAPGCIYLVSSYGVTGLRDSFYDHLLPLIKKIKSKTDKCIMLGFGISNEDQVSEIMNFSLKVDAIVMGSAFIEQISSSLIDDNYEKLTSFCREIKRSMVL